MRGLIGIGVVLGFLSTAAHGAPQGRIICTGEPHLEGFGADGVEISTDAVGLVRVVDTPAGGDDEDAISAKDFCAAHEGVDAFILPAPRMIDEPRSPDEEELELEPNAGPPGAQGAGDKPLEAVDSTQDDDSDGQATKSMAGLADVSGPHKSLGHQMAAGPGCRQAVGHTRTGWWFALLPLLLLIRARGEGDR